jgi:hypothetical protein
MALKALHDGICGEMRQRQEKYLLKNVTRLYDIHHFKSAYRPFRVIMLFNRAYSGKHHLDRLRKRHGIYSHTPININLATLFPAFSIEIYNVTLAKNKVDRCIDMVPHS